MADPILQPVAEMRLSAFLRRLEHEARFTIDRAKHKLDKMLEKGLKVYNQSGQEALYKPFKEEAEADGMPVAVKVQGDTDIILMEDIFNDKMQERLEQFVVRREDVATYYDYDHFPWEDESGASVDLPCNEHKKQAFITYDRAEKILIERFKTTPDGIPHQTTPEEIAQWIIHGEIKARSSKYTGAWIVDFGNWKTDLITKYSGDPNPNLAFPTLDDCLVPCHFCEAELNQFEPDEWWLSYRQVTERWKNCGYNEQRITAILANHFSGIGIIVNNPRPLKYKEIGPILEGKSKATLDDIKETMYPLSVIRIIEEENGIKVFSESTTTSESLGNFYAQSPDAQAIPTPQVSTKNTFKAAKLRKETSECTLAQFFKPWAVYCESQNECPYEGFRTLMDWGVTVKAGWAGTVGEDWKFDNADVRVGFKEARQAAMADGDFGLKSIGIEAQTPAGNKVEQPLSRFILSRENVLDVFAKQGIHDFHWPEDGLPGDQIRKAENQHSPNDGTIQPASATVEGPRTVDDSDTDRKNRRDMQIDMILEVVEKLGYPPLNIPEGGKSAIKAECLKDTHLFTDSGFRHAWKNANKRNVISMQDKEKYLSNQ